MIFYRLAAVVVFVLLFSICITGIMFSCKPDEDNIAPEITILEPMAGSIYAVKDTIHLSAIFSDNNEIKSIKVTLIDSENRPMLAPISVDLPSNPFSLISDYPITDSLLKSGSYELQFQAFDGVNTTNVFVKIAITELQKKFLYPIIVTQNATNLVSAYSYSPNGWTKFFNQQGDYVGSAVNSPHQQFYISGVSKSNLTAWSLKEKRVLWTRPALNYPHGHWFESVSYQDPLLYVSYYEGYISSFDKSGNALFNTEITTPYYPLNSCMAGNFIAAALRNKENKSSALGIYYGQGGALKSLKNAVPFIVSLLPLGENRVLTFGNRNGSGFINLYRIADDLFTEIKEVPNDSLCEVAAMDADNYFISGRQRVYWFRYSNNSLVVFADGIAKAHLACEFLNQQVYIGSGKKISVYNFPQGNPEELLNLPDSLLAIHLLYNK